MGKWKHVVSNINKETKRGNCANCGIDVALTWTGRRLACSIAVKEQKGGPDPAVYLRGKHGYTLAEIRKMREGKFCEICGSSEKIVFDHDHKTNRGRGFLCNSCNIALGLFKDDPALLNQAVEYLRITANRQDFIRS